MDIRAEKERIRREALARRRMLSPDERVQQSTIIADRLFATPEWQAATAVGLYASLWAEVATDAIIARALNEGKMVALPRVKSPRTPLCKEGGVVAFHRITSLDELVIGTYGVREPSVATPIVDVASLDLIVVPGVAFDRSGARLGYGRGYYDRVLARARGETIGLAFIEQIVAMLPAEPYDIRVGRVITAG